MFRPREAHRKALTALADAGWSTTGIVTLSQLVAFLSFQVRARRRPPGARRLPEGIHGMSGFTQDRIGWRPWLTPLAERELTDEHYEALVDKARAALAVLPAAGP